MRTKFFIALVVLTGLLSSCKNDKSVDSLEAATPENVDKNFKVTLNAIVTQDDSFQLYFSEEEFGAPGHAAAYEEKNSVWVNVKANPNPQDIVFILPENVIPNYLRMDLGTNVKQDGIVIKNFNMSYNDKKFDAKEGVFFNLFVPNQSVKIENNVTGQIKTVTMPNGTYDPVFYSDLPLYTEIQKLIK